MEQNSLLTTVYNHVGERNSFFFVVSGAGNQEEGIGMEGTWNDVRRLIENGPKENLEKHNYCALLFVIEESMPFPDLEAQERYGWELARNNQNLQKNSSSSSSSSSSNELDTKSSNYYPYPICFPTLPPKIEEMYRPTRRELFWLELALKIICNFSKTLTRNTAEINNGQPMFESNVPVQLHSGKTIVNYSHWPIHDHWNEMEKYLEKEKEKFNALSCKVCHKVEDGVSIILKKCGACKAKLYCSRECQASDWKNHKTQCQPQK